MKPEKGHLRLQLRPEPPTLGIRSVAGPALPLLRMGLGRVPKGHAFQFQCLFHTGEKLTSIDGFYNVVECPLSYRIQSDANIFHAANTDRPEDACNRDNAVRSKRLNACST